MDSLPATVASALVEADSADSETDWPARWQALTAVSVELQSLLVTDPGPDLVALIEQIVTQLADGVAGSRRHRVELAELAHRVLSTHARACAETAPDPVRLAVPKAFVILRQGHEPSRELAKDIFSFLRASLAPYKRVRRLEFSDLPKTISGKIRRVELRTIEAARRNAGEKGEWEFFEEEFPELKE